MCVCHGSDRRFSGRPTVKLLEVGLAVLRKLWWGVHDFEDFWKKLSRNAFSGLLIYTVGLTKNHVITEYYTF